MRDAAHVAYPAGATGDASVVVNLTIDREGHVVDAHVVEGREPFAAATLDAAPAWSFTPARRGDVPVASRIRLLVDFHPPLPNPPAEGAPADAAQSPTHSAAASAPANEGTTEVHVRGARLEVGETKLGGAEVREIPGAFGDAFRAIEALPGVTPILSGLPFFFVRGAPPGNVGYFIDGVQVPLLYHLALGPSVIHPGLIDHVDFFPGGYPARFGRYAGGILDGETLPPATKAHAEGNVRLFDAGALGEAPLLDGKVSVLVAGRYSYTAALVQLVAKDTRVGYWDYQARVAYKLNHRDSLSVFSGPGASTRSTTAIGPARTTARGTSWARRSGPSDPIFKTEFHRLDLRYDHDTPHGHFRLAATLGVEDSLAGSTLTEHTSVGSHDVRLRAEGEERVAPQAKLRYGADVLLTHYSIDTGQSPGLDVRSLYPDRNDVMTGAYVDAVWKASDRVEVVPGLRADVFTSRLASPSQVPPPSTTFGNSGPLAGAMTNATATIGVDPRLATRLAASRHVTWVTTFGVSHQPPSLFVPIPGLTLGRLNSGLQTSLQASEGIELALPSDVTLTATGFLQNYLGLTDATATCLGNGTDLSQASNDCLAAKVNGRAFGMELLLRRDLTKRLTGWISYTLLPLDARDARPRRPLRALPRAHLSATAGAAGGAGDPLGVRPYPRPQRDRRVRPGPWVARRRALLFLHRAAVLAGGPGRPRPAVQLPAIAGVLSNRRPAREAMAGVRQREPRRRPRRDERDSSEGGDRRYVPERRDHLPAEVRHVLAGVHRARERPQHRTRGLDCIDSQSASTTTRSRSTARSAASRLTADGARKSASRSNPKARSKIGDSSIPRSLSSRKSRESCSAYARARTPVAMPSKLFARRRLAMVEATRATKVPLYSCRSRARASGAAATAWRKKWTFSGTWNDSSRVRIVSIWRTAGCRAPRRAMRYVVDPIVSNMRFTRTIDSIRFARP